VQIIKCNTKYLSEDEEVFKAVEDIILSENRGKYINLIQAPTGTGKTHLFFKILKTNKVQYIYVLPNIATSDNLAKSEKIISVHSRTKSNFRTKLVSGEPFTCTIDQLKNLEGIRPELLSNVVLIVDEAHYVASSLDFKREAIRSLKYALGLNFKNVIFVTATMGALQVLIEPKIKVTKIMAKRQTRYLINELFFREGEIDKIKAYIDTLDGQVLMYSNTSKLDNDLIASQNEGWYSINADTPDNDVVKKAVINEQTIPDYVKVLIATDIFTAGLNIKHSNIKHCVLNNVHDPATFNQFISRPRGKEELIIHSFIGNEAPKLTTDSDSEITFLDNLLIDAKISMQRLSRKKELKESVPKFSKEFKLIDYSTVNNIVQFFEINYFMIAHLSYKSTFHNAPWYNRYKYLVDAPEESFTSLTDASNWYADNLEFVNNAFDEKSIGKELSDRRKELREEKKIEKELAYSKALDVIENNKELIFYRRDFPALAIKEGLNPKEIDLIRNIARRYEKYNLEIPLLVKLDKDEKYRNKLMYQSLGKNNKINLEYDSIILAIKNNYKKGRKIPKFNYLTTEGRKFKEIFEAIWEYNEDKVITGKRTDWKNLTANERKELRKMFYIETSKK